MLKRFSVRVFTRIVKMSQKRLFPAEHPEGQLSQVLRFVLFLSETSADDVFERLNPPSPP